VHAVDLYIFQSGLWSLDTVQVKHDLLPFFAEVAPLSETRIHSAADRQRAVTDDISDRIHSVFATTVEV
jgi:hypothetical protein